MVARRDDSIMVVWLLGLLTVVTETIGQPTPRDRKIKQNWQSEDAGTSIHICKGHTTTETIAEILLVGDNSTAGYEWRYIGERIAIVTYQFTENDDPEVLDQLEIRCIDNQAAVPTLTEWGIKTLGSLIVGIGVVLTDYSEALIVLGPLEDMGNSAGGSNL